MSNPKNFAMAVGMAKRKKMAKGGRVHKGPGGREATEDTHGPTGPTNYRNRNKSSDMDHGQKKGPQGYPKYQEQAQNEKGIHTPVSGVTGFPGGKGTSEAGDFATETWGGKPHRELRDHGKELHKKKLEEMKAMPKPDLPMAAGGKVQKRISHPKMMKSDAFSVKMRDEEPMAKGGEVDHDLAPQSTMHPEMLKQAKAEHAKMQKNRKTGFNPSEADNARIRKEIASQKLAEGGEVPPKSKPKTGIEMYDEATDPKHIERIWHSLSDEAKNHISARAIAKSKAKKMAEGGEVEEMGAGPEEDQVIHPDGLEQSDDQMAIPEEESMADHEQMLAEGGMAELDMEHEDSIAAAIMAKRDRMHAAIDSGAMDLDHAAHMAEGGEVDLSINADEEPNNEDQMSLEALKKENYSESEGLDDLDQPLDSNEEGDSREDNESDPKDMVDSIRRKMHVKRQFKAR